MTTAGDRARAEERWRETWALAALPPPEALLDELVERYTEPHRAYHDLTHVLACLEEAGRVRRHLESPFEVELALWYHDAVYRPRWTDNEERSAELAIRRLRGLIADRSTAAVDRLILATRHDGAPAAGDVAYVVDIDLAILGAPQEDFARYDAGVRQEYRWVPWPLFRRKRREVLQSLLDRPRIYATAELGERLEARARENLRRAVCDLS